MEERTVAVATAAGSMESFVVHPSGRGPFPAVIMYMDMWGMRECLRDLARRVATTGYYCILPDAYYRRGRVRYAERELEGTRLSFESLERERQVALRDAMDGLSDAMVMEDTSALLRFMDQGEPVQAGALGAIGYCMGGRHAFCAAGTYPERFAATACIHGTDLIKSGPDSPHRLARSARGEIYCGHAERDKYAPADVARQLEEHFRGAAVRCSHELHRGAQHAYAIPDRDVFDKHAANRDWEMIHAMFARQLLQKGL